MNGVQGVASSNLVIPTRISGSCDGESRLPFLLNFFRPGLSSYRAVFSRAAGPLRVALFFAPAGACSFRRNTAGSPRVRLSPADASFLACLFLRSLVRQPRSLRNSQSCLQKRGGHPENVWGIFFTAPERSVARVSRAKSRRVGETGIFGRQSPASPTCSPRQSERDFRELRCSRSVTADTPG